tara:strand:+ start:2250 stop:4385 length:2136 start_codon:yes stop_codon:yes gene_type:complete
MPGPLGSGGGSPHHLAPQISSTPLSRENQSSDLNWESIVDQLPFGLIVLGPSQELQHENEVCRSMMGSGVRETGGIEAWLAGLCPDPEHREKVITSWREHIWRNQLTRTFTLKGADQKIREIEFRSSLAANGVFTLVLQDITDIRRAEETQRHNKLKFRAMFAHAGNGAVLVDRTGRVIDANSTFLDLVSLSLREIRLSTLSSLLHPEDAKELAAEEEAWRNSDDTAGSNSITREVWLRSRSKEKRARLTYCPIGDSRSHPSMGIYLFEPVDTGESRDQLLSKFRKVAGKAQALLNAVPDLILLINEDLSIADFAPPPQPWAELKPDEAWRGRNAADVWPVLGELLLSARDQVTRDGKTVHADLQGRGAVPFDFTVTFSSCGDGQMLAVIRNHTGMRQSAEQANWMAPVLENASQGILVADAEGKIIEVNPALATLIGETPADLIGRSLTHLYQGDSDEITNQISKLLASRASWTCHAPLLIQSGRDYQVTTEFIPVSEGGDGPAMIGLFNHEPQPSESPASLAKERIQHSFRNQLQLITSLFSLEPQGAAARDAFLKWQIRLRAIAQTLPGSAEGFQAVPMMRAIADEVCTLTGHGPGRIEVKIDGSDTLRVDASNATSFALMCGEIMRLILGQRQLGRGPELFLALRQDDQGHLRLQVRPGENRKFIFTDEDSEIEILEILTDQMKGQLEPLTPGSTLEWELIIPADPG